MDINVQARSDQINADDLIAGPMTFTIREVVPGKAEQPYDFMLVETDRAYRPNKTMLRGIVTGWGDKGSEYVGRRLTLYRDPSIKFGSAAVGGIRISHMSHVDSPVEWQSQVTRGKRQKFVIQPLREDRPAPAPADPIATLRAEWGTADDNRRKVIEAEVARLQAEQEGA